MASACIEWLLRFTGSFIGSVFAIILHPSVNLKANVIRFVVSFLGGALFVTPWAKALPLFSEETTGDLIAISVLSGLLTFFLFESAVLFFSNKESGFTSIWSHILYKFFPTSMKKPTDNRDDDAP